MLARCCRAVAGLLGNTPAVCRASYIHPAVFEAYVDGRLAAALPEPEAPTFETALIGLLETAAAAPLSERAPAEPGAGRRPGTGGARFNLTPSNTIAKLAA